MLIIRGSGELAFDLSWDSKSTESYLTSVTEGGSISFLLKSFYLNMKRSGVGCGGLGVNIFYT